MSKLWKNIGWGVAKLGAGIGGTVLGGPAGGALAVGGVTGLQAATDKDKQYQYRHNSGKTLGMDALGVGLTYAGGKIAQNAAMATETAGDAASATASATTSGTAASGTGASTNVSGNVDKIVASSKGTPISTNVAKSSLSTKIRPGMGYGKSLSVSGKTSFASSNLSTEPVTSNVSLVSNAGPKNVTEVVTPKVLPDKSFSTAVNREFVSKTGTGLKPMTMKSINLPEKVVTPDSLTGLTKDTVVQGGGEVVKNQGMSKQAKGLMYANLGKAAVDVGLSVKGMNDLKNMKAPSVAPPPMVKPEYTPDTVSSTQAAEEQNIETALANKKKTDLATGRSDSSEDAILEMTANNKLAATIEQGRTARNQMINDNQFRADSVNQGMIANVNAANASMSANFEAMRGGMESELLNTAMNAPFSAAQSILGTKVSESNRKDTLINALATAQPKEREYILAELKKLGYNA